MVDSKVSALALASAPDGTEMIPVVQGGVSKKVTVATLRQIQMSDVTNLTTTLAGKAATGHSHTDADINNFQAAVRREIGLGIAQGANVTLTTDPTTKVVTIASTGGSGGGSGDAAFVLSTVLNALQGVGGISWTTPDGGAHILATISGVAIASITGLQTALDGKIDKSTVTTKGDLLVASASGVVARFPIGTDGQVPIADSTQTLGIKYGPVPTPTNMADKTGSVNQFADMDKSAPADGNFKKFDGGSLTWKNIDITTLFANLDPTTGRLAQANEPTDFHPIKVLNSGDPVPVGTRLDTLIFRLPALTSLIPVPLGSNFAQGSNNVVVTFGQALAVGDWFSITVGCDGIFNTITLGSIVAALSAGAATITWQPTVVPNGGAATVNAICQVTTAIPSGTTVTLTAKQTDGTTNTTRVHLIGMLAKLPGLVASAPIDQEVHGGGASTTNMLALSTPVTQNDIAQAREIALGSAVWNSGSAGTTPAVTRVLADTYNGWNKVMTSVKSDNNATARTLAFFYQIQTAVGKPALTTSMTASDGSTGQWATQLVTLKGGST